MLSRLLRCDVAVASPIKTEILDNKVNFKIEIFGLMFLQKEENKNKKRPDLPIGEDREEGVQQNCDVDLSLKRKNEPEKSGKESDRMRKRKKSGLMKETRG